MSIQGIQPQPSQQTYYSSQSQSVPESKTSDAAPGKAAEVCIASTDKVDEEIAQLKAREAMLAQKLHSAGDSVQQDSLEEELSRVENELRQKDNDTYRRQNTEFSSGVDVKA